MRLFRRGESASTLDLLVAGLGNPGREYERTRHNVGWLVADELARRHGGSFRSKFSGRVAEVRLDQPIQAQVSVHLVGEPRGVTEGGVLSQVSRDVRVEGLPMDIPEHLELDVSEMGIGDTMRLVDLPPREGITYLDDPEEMLEEGEEQPEAPDGGEPESGTEAPGEPDAAAAGGEGTVEG